MRQTLRTYSQRKRITLYGACLSLLVGVPLGYIFRDTDLWFSMSLVFMSLISGGVAGYWTAGLYQIRSEFTWDKAIVCGVGSALVGLAVFSCLFGVIWVLFVNPEFIAVFKTNGLIMAIFSITFAIPFGLIAILLGFFVFFWLWIPAGIIAGLVVYGMERCVVKP